jgi:hypothetical protein
MERPILKRKKNLKWESDEVELLVSMLLAGQPFTKVVKALDRTEAAIRRQATLIGVSAAEDLRLRDARNRRLGKKLDD